LGRTYCSCMLPLHIGATQLKNIILTGEKINLKRKLKISLDILYIMFESELPSCTCRFEFQ